MAPFASPLGCSNSLSAAKLFVQLAPKRGSEPVLEFLLPRSRSAISSRTLHSSSVRARRLETTTGTRHGSLPTTVGWSIPRGLLHANYAPSTISKTFAHTARRRYTQAVYNPQQDEDGNDMTLDITPRAAKRLTEIMSKDNNPQLALRIQVESGGCHGFQYLMSLVTLPESIPPKPAAAAEASEHPGEGAGSGEVREDDTIFTYTPEEGQQADLKGAKIILDQPSLDLLKGSKVDFTMELIGSQFKIVDNPLATSSCGCGTSFDIKM
ncbi:[4Fe-4S] proteins maturation [Diaporthe eres]|uniref:[4Fe-4S] proteins maturation n=1 Tax=Diaporthe eres TaxID=83184 RepID=A0ABR1PCY3_DIAER